MLISLVHTVSPNINRCELTFLERQVIDYELAVQQHADYCRLLQNCGAQVVTLSANRAHPDACFIEDTAVVLDEIAVIASPGAVSRRGEVTAVEGELKKYRETVRIDWPATLEGGDVLQVGRTVFVGRSNRTNSAGIEALEKILRRFDYQVIPVELRQCLHLKSACTALEERCLLVNPAWIEMQPFADFQKVTVPDTEIWSANTIRVRDTVVLHEGFPDTIKLLRELDFKVASVNISEFLKAEAGLSCLSLRFES
ncbi:MAG: dimethylarginine dimethylaminohydrolase family protein [bacterium]